MGYISKIVDKYIEILCNCIHISHCRINSNVILICRLHSEISIDENKDVLCGFHKHGRIKSSIMLICRVHIQDQIRQIFNLKLKIFCLKCINCFHC